MAETYTVEQLAAAFREQNPKYAEVPDAQLVQAILEKYPQYKQNLVGAKPSLMSPPETPKELSPDEPPGLYRGIGERVKGNLDPLPQLDYVGQLGETLLHPTKSPYWQHGGGLKATGETLKETYSKPENVLGDLITAYISHAAGGGGGENLPELPKPVRNTVAKTMQYLSGAGKEPVLMERIRREARITKANAAYEAARAEIEKGNSRRAAEHAARVKVVEETHKQAEAAAQAKYQQELQEYQKASQDKKAEYAKRIVEAQRDWVEKAAKARSAEREAAKVSNRRETLTRGQNEYGDRLRKNLKNTYQTVKSRLDSRWNKLRTTQINRAGKLSILNDETGNAKALKEGMETAEKKFLHGSPGSVRVFRDLAGWIEQGEKGALKDPTWDELRTHYSSIGDALYGRPIAPNVMRALQYIRNDVIGAQLNEMAVKAGVGEDYTSLLKDSSRFESDWKDTQSITRKGGSPLAVALQAPNASTLIPQVTGKTGDLLIERLGKYTDAGASPQTAAAIRKLHGEVNNLPTVRVPSMPGKLELPTDLKLGEPPQPPVIKPPKIPEAPKAKIAKPPQAPPPVDPAAVRRQRILSYTGRPESAYDLIPPRFPTKNLLGFDAIREWVANLPRKELPIPEGAKAKGIRPARWTGPISEPYTDEATRRGPGEPIGPSLEQQYTLRDNLRMRYEQQKAAGDPGQWATASKLKDVEETLKAAESAKWGPKQATSPRTVSSAG